MTTTQISGLVSALLGFIGTFILFLASYTLQPLAGFSFGSPDVTKYNEEVKATNASRIRRQWVGFAFLCVSFLIQAVTVFL